MTQFPSQSGCQLPIPAPRPQIFPVSPVFWPLAHWGHHGQLIQSFGSYSHLYYKLPSCLSYNILSGFAFLANLLDLACRPPSKRCILIISYFSYSTVPRNCESHDIRNASINTGADSVGLSRKCALGQMGRKPRGYRTTRRNRDLKSR